MNYRSLAIIFVVLLFPIIILGQNISISELAKARSMNEVEFEEYLTSKGWELFEAEKENNFSVLTFGYNIINDEADSFISMHFLKEPSDNYLMFQIHDAKKYSRYLDEIKSFNGKLIQSEIGNNAITKIYKGATTTIVIQSQKIVNPFNNAVSNRYLFFLYKNEAYAKTYSDDVFIK